MKQKILFLSVALFFCCYFVKAQTVQVGVTAGWGFTTQKNNSDAIFGGVMADIELSEKFYMQPSAVYVHEGKDAHSLRVPVLGKYYVSNKLHLLGGPEMSFFLSKTHGVKKSFNLDLSVGGGYDLNKHFFVNARYIFGLTPMVEYENHNEKYSMIALGIGYKF